LLEILSTQGILEEVASKVIKIIGSKHGIRYIKVYFL
jgi:hypothetical protein